MLPVKVQRVFLAQHRVDFRKGIDGLLGEAYRLGADPYNGDCVLFVKRDHTQLRALVGDGIGSGDATVRRGSAQGIGEFHGTAERHNDYNRRAVPSSRGSSLHGTQTSGVVSFDHIEHFF